MKTLLALALCLIINALNAQDIPLPSIGKFMLTKENGKFVPAHWLGATYGGKDIQEPINIILVDDLSETAEEAQNQLQKACNQAGFPLRYGHSSGYFGVIDNKMISQFDSNGARAFSDGAFEFNNDHGRIFGPYLFQDHYYFIAAFSREDVAPFKKVKHQYDSFNRARDRFAENLDDKTSFKKTRFVNLNNAIIQSKELTTGDHDGIAVMLELKE